MMKKMDDEKVNRARLNCDFYISASITAKHFCLNELWSNMSLFIG